MSHAVDNAVIQWEEGFRALQEARSDPPAYRALGRAVMAIQEELRKRLGSSFSVGELAALYRQGADWALDIAMAEVADEWFSETSATVDAAFYLYMREAADFAGGSRRGE